MAVAGTYLQYAFQNFFCFIRSVILAYLDFKIFMIMNYAVQ